MPDVSAGRTTDAAPTASASIAPLTTLRLGGPAGQILTVTDADEIVQSLRATARAGEPTLMLGGGSNVVVADDGFPGTVILIRSRGLRVVDSVDGALTVRVQAGEDWDDVVATAVAERWSGLECLSGIPGSAGATPIQNVGAYGQEVAETLTAVQVLDRVTDQVTTLGPAECGFGYRTSVFKRSDRWVVLSADFRLQRASQSAPVRYVELAKALGVPVGTRVPLETVRSAVLALRARKGMVLDDTDPDTFSAGSFFTNPILEAGARDALWRRSPEQPPWWPAGDGRIKVSAAWLIERAGFTRGYGGPDVAISSKHSLALTNRGGGTTTGLLALAREIRGRVYERFTVTLVPEPTLVGCDL